MGQGISFWGNVRSKNIKGGKGGTDNWPISGPPETPFGRDNVSPLEIRRGKGSTTGSLGKKWSKAPKKQVINRKG